MNKKDREAIKMKFGGRCAYTGLQLPDDWQIDHMNPVIRNPYNNGCLFPQNENNDNLVPTFKEINNYKSNCDLHSFRNWLLGELHLRLVKLPKNPVIPKSIIHKRNLLRIAELFGITPDKPFNRVFYFETLKKEKNDNN